MKHRHRGPRWYSFDAAQVASLILLVLGLALLIAAAPWSAGNAWQSDVMLGFSGNLITGAITAFVVDVIAQRRSTLEQFHALLVDIRSGDKGIVNRGFAALREAGWLLDGTLENVDFSYIKLQGVDLAGARLNGAILTGATLEGCSLRNSQLRKVVLDAATIRNCDFSEADLSGARGLLSDWAKSDLHAAKLNGAKFGDAHFEDMDFRKCVSEGAQMPDGFACN